MCLVILVVLCRPSLSSCPRHAGPGSRPTPSRPRLFLVYLGLPGRPGSTLGPCQLFPSKTCMDLEGGFSGSPPIPPVGGLSAYRWFDGFISR